MRLVESIRLPLLAAALLACPVCSNAQPGTAGIQESETDATSATLRVAAIGFRLATANSGECSVREPATGLLFHDLGGYPAALRPAVTSGWGLTDGFGILGVVPGSPGTAAGLQPGDEIVGVAGQRIAALPLPAVTARASYDRVAAFSAILRDKLRAGSVRLDVRRGVDVRQVSLRGVPSCAADFVLVPQQRPEAWSDERAVAVSSGLAQLADDDELSFAMAHELAHILLGHAGPAKGQGGSKTRELAADELALKLVRNAGYDTAGGERLLKLLASRKAGEISFSHPAFAKRIARLRAKQQADSIEVSP
jgi:hypothetical protein